LCGVFLRNSATYSLFFNRVIQAELSEAEMDLGEVPLANALVPYIRVNTTIFDSLITATLDLPFARSRQPSWSSDLAEGMVRQPSPTPTQHLQLIVGGAHIHMRSGTNDTWPDCTAHHLIVSSATTGTHLWSKN
jgi:hypothetical protein